MQPAGRPRTASTAPGIRLEALTLASKAFTSALAPDLRPPHPAPHTWACLAGSAACSSGPREDLLASSLSLHRVRGSCYSLISPCNNHCVIIVLFNCLPPPRGGLWGGLHPRAHCSTVCMELSPGRGGAGPPLTKRTAHPDVKRTVCPDILVTFPRVLLGLLCRN